MFTAPLSVLAFLIGLACLLAAIAGDAIKLGDFSVPTVKETWQRWLFALIGIVVLAVPLWPSLTNQSLGDTVAQFFPQLSFQSDYNNLEAAIEKTPTPDYDAAQDRARDMYDRYLGSRERCRVLSLLGDHLRETSQAQYIPDDFIGLILRYQSGSPDTRSLLICGRSIQKLAQLEAASENARLQAKQAGVISPSPSGATGSLIGVGSAVATTKQLVISSLAIHTPSNLSSASASNTTPGPLLSNLTSKTAGAAHNVADPCAHLPQESDAVLPGCGETTNSTFGENRIKVYSEKSAHKTTIHFRNLGERPLSLSIIPGCDGCPQVNDALLHPSRGGDTSEDYCYSGPAPPFRFGWIIGDASRVKPGAVVSTCN